MTARLPACRCSSHLAALFLLLVMLVLPTTLAADPADEWWDDGWPYRIPVTVSGNGTVQVTIDFTAAFASLGLNGGLLDLRSLRVVPYDGSTPLAPVPHAESLSTMLEDADNPQIGWSSSGVYWAPSEATAVADGSRHTQGSGSVKVVVTNQPDGYGYPGVSLWITSGEPLTDWRPYEVLIYDVWPAVNASALDQAPDLYWFKLYNTTGCTDSNITQGGPALALDRWNRVSVSLNPLHTCTTPDLADITRLELHTRDNETVFGNSGLWDDGDQLTLWLDNIRLVDQDGGGTIRWVADGSTSSYYVYFDVLEHEGHDPPELAALGTASLTGSTGATEAGGYLHLVQGASTGGLAVWSAPPAEKILRTTVPPVATAPLLIQAAQGELEPIQLVVRSPSTQDLAVSISDLVSGGSTLPAAAVSLHRVDYVTLTQLSDDFGRLGDWPDPLYPLAMGSTVSFSVGSNQPLWFTVHVPRTAIAGTYQGTISIGTATVPVSLQVWGFALPQEIHLPSEWGFGWSDVVETWKGTIDGDVQPCYWSLVDALYEDFADHRLTPKGVGWPAGLNYPGGVAYDCATATLDPYSWGEWGFHDLADRYLAGSDLDNGTGFPTFLIRGPNDNWPPASRPSGFCGESRGTDPPGGTAYNTAWFAYWGAVSDYLGATADYADRGYYHVVNEPQTFDDYDIVAYLSRETHTAAPNVRIMVSEQVEPAIYDNDTYPGGHIDIWMPTISNYQVERAHERQTNHGEEVWWYFLYGDRPPLPNPTVIDRTGLEARIVPWLAWLERVDGLLYYSITDWSSDPWSTPWFNDGNGDGFLLYPPRDAPIATDPCNDQSNRLVPSIRWELLREGMEDYEYLWLVNGGPPRIGVSSDADSLAGRFIQSRTLFSRVPTDLAATRVTIASYLQTTVFADGFESGDTSQWRLAVP